MADVEAYVAAGADLSGPAWALDAPLDNGGLRSQISSRQGRRAEERNEDAKVKRQQKKRRYHARLVAMLGRIGVGEFGARVRSLPRSGLTRSSGVLAWYGGMVYAVRTRFYPTVASVRCAPGVRGGWLGGGQKILRRSWPALGVRNCGRSLAGRIKRS